MACGVFNYSTHVSVCRYMCKRDIPLLASAEAAPPSSPTPSLCNNASTLFPSAHETSNCGPDICVLVYVCSTAYGSGSLPIMGGGVYIHLLFPRCY